MQSHRPTSPAPMRRDASEAHEDERTRRKREREEHLARLRAMDWPELPRRLSADEACAVANISSRTLGRWRASRLVRMMAPLGGKLLVDRDSLRAFIEAAE